MGTRTVVAATVWCVLIASCADDGSGGTADTDVVVTTTAPATTLTPTTVPATTLAPTSVPGTTTTTEPADDVATESSGRCRQSADLVVLDVLSSFGVGDRSLDCVDPSLHDRLLAIADLVDDVGLGFDVDTTPVRTENPVAGTSGWVVSVALVDHRDEPPGDRSIQRWTLVENDRDALVVTEVEDIETDAMVAEGESTVETYLARLATGDFDGAAGLLGEGGQSWDERRDLSAFAEPPAVPPDLARSLRDWCARGALCTEPLRTTANPTIRGGAAEVVATWEVDGSEVTATFLGRNYEGAPAVSGLPPIAGPDAVSAVAARAGASVAVGVVPGVGVVRWADGEVAEVPVPDDSWTDGTYFYRWEDVEATPARTSASLADGTTVCEVDGRIQWVRERNDGTYVATVLRDDEVDFEGDAEWPIPTYAVDCATGESTPIETISWQREGGSRTTETVAGRTFEVDGDAEGNADVFNEDGVSVNGEDYAGLHAFAPDASVVVYGDYGVSHSPHITTTIRARDTIDGTLLWSAELDRPFGSLDVTDDTVVVSQPPERHRHEPWWAVESVWVFDRATGERRHEIPTPVQLLYVD